MPVSFASPSQIAAIARAYHYILEKAPVFETSFISTLAANGREQFERVVTERLCQRGEIILWEGEANEALYIVRSGLLAVIKGNLDEPEPIVLGFRGPGEVVGEMSLIEDRASSATVVALDLQATKDINAEPQPIQLLCVSREDFYNMIASTPAAGMSILRLMSARLRQSSEAQQVETAVQHQLKRQVVELKTEQEQLTELNRVRQELTNFILHDLRNPIGALMGAVELLRMVLPKDILSDNEEIISLAAESAERLSRLVNTVLEVARMESGELQLNLLPMHIPLVIDDVLRRVPPLTRQKLHFRSTAPAHLPAVRADRDLIERVLTNLLDNAIKYTPANGTITLSAELIDNALKVSINDTGPGIPLEQRTRIFERFAQVKGEQFKRRGFGLGLNFCEMTVRLHGGMIGIEDGDDGIGTKFVFTLPMSKSQYPLPHALRDL